jgi:Tol biopolymer transport system component
MVIGNRVAKVAIVAVIVAGLSGCERWESGLASGNGAGTDSGNQKSWDPVMTPDGTKVVFTSYASDLGPTDTNGASDIYVRDLTTGVTELVSVDVTGTDSGNEGSQWPNVSPDGTKIVFRSDATDLTSTPAGIYDQLYLRDLTTDTTTLISANAEGTGGGNGSTGGDDLFSPDGTKLLFSSEATDLVGPPTAAIQSVFEHDLVTGTTVRLGNGYGGVYSPAGDAVAYVNGEVVVRDLATGTEVVVSAGAPGVTNNGVSFSHDGNRIAFRRETPPGGFRHDFYVYDRTTGAVTLATPAAVGAGGSNGRGMFLGFHPSDADQLLFVSAASNLLPNDTNSAEDVFVRDLSARTTTPVALVGGSNVPAGAGWARWMPDGKVAFISESGALGPRDTNVAFDIYVRDLDAGTNQLVTTNAAGDDSADGQSGQFQPIHNEFYFTYELSIDRDGERIAFGSDATNLGPVDTPRAGAANGSHDIYVANLVTPPAP